MLLDHDHHTHTIYSKHSDPRMTVENSLAAAEAAGVRRIVVLEHVPEISAERATIGQWRKGRNQRPQLDDIAADLDVETPRHPALTVLRGVEVDADPFALDGSAMLDEFSGLDVIIGSTHVLPGGEAFWFDRVSLSPDRAEEVACEWFAWAERFVRSGLIHVLAHPGDLIGARQLVPTFDQPEVLDAFDPILRAMADGKVAFELNELLGSKLPPPYRAAYPALVRRARSFGLKFSVSSDAHRPEIVGKYNWVRELIDGAGLTVSDLWTPPAPKR